MPEIYPTHRTNEGEADSRPKRRTPPKYTPLTNAYARWLFGFKRDGQVVWPGLIDRRDFGQRHPTGDRSFTRVEKEALNAWMRRERYATAHMTRRQIEAHVKGLLELHYVSLRSDGFALVMIDVDAHEGQTDAPETARFIQARYFPGAFMEPSPRGYHLYLVVRVGRVPRRRFNALLAEAAAALGAVLREHGFSSTVEAKGGFNEVEAVEGAEKIDYHTGEVWTLRQVSKCSDLACLPRLHKGEADLERLTGAPVFLLEALHRVIDEGKAVEEGRQHLGGENGDNKAPTTHSLLEGCLLKPEEGDAWDRMWSCYRDLASSLGRPPDENELMVEYDRLHPGGDWDRDRWRRAKSAVSYGRRTFDPQKAGSDERWVEQRDELLRLVEAHCTPESFRVERVNRATGEAVVDDWAGKIPHDVLAVVLYVVTRGSFAQRDDALLQWTAGNESLRAMFHKLRKEKVYDGPVPGTNQIVAAKRVLESAGLIECFDASYQRSGWGGKGVSKKYHVGRNHPRYFEFAQFEKTVEVEKLSDVRAKRKAKGAQRKAA